MLRAAAVTALAATSTKPVSVLNSATLNTESINGVYGTKLACDSPCEFGEISPSFSQCICLSSAPYSFQVSLGLDWQNSFSDIGFSCSRIVLALKAEKQGDGNCYVDTVHGQQLMHTDKQVHLYDVNSTPHLHCDAGTQFQSSSAYFICPDWNI